MTHSLRLILISSLLGLCAVSGATEVTPRIVASAAAAAPGDTVTWTLTITCTGSEEALSVMPVLALGSGVTYVSSTPSGSLDGDRVTWNYGSMVPGNIVAFDVVTTVTSCEQLSTEADVTWVSGGASHDTADDGATAYSSIQRTAHAPVLSFTPPDISFSYGGLSASAAVDIGNSGDAPAVDPYLYVDFGPMSVSNISSGASYNAAEKRFELPDIAVSGTYALSFQVDFNGWCAGTFPEGRLLWRGACTDACGNGFEFPPEISDIYTPSGKPSFTATLSGVPKTIAIGDSISCTVESAYMGALSSESGSTGEFTVTFTVPDGFSVVDADGGVWVPGGGGTGGTVVWTYTPPATLNRTIAFMAPMGDTCETYCHSAFTCSLAASGTDCAGCTLSASDSASGVIECEEGVDSEKTAVPGTAGRCGIVSYTNTYSFSGGVNINLNGLYFGDHAERQQQFVPGTLSVVFNGSDIAGCVNATDGTPGGMFTVDFSGCPAMSLNGKTLVISYQLTLPEAAAAPGERLEFFSWSELYMGATGSQCLTDGTIFEVTPVTIEPPSMSVTIAGMPETVATTGSYDVTFTVEDTSQGGAHPKDVQFVVSGANQYALVGGSASCAGDVSPVSCTPSVSGNDFIWTFNDGFTASGQDAILSLQLTKRCATSSELVATAYFDDACGDDATADRSCSATTTAAPLLLEGNLLLEVTPDTYYMTDNVPHWTAYLTNSGPSTVNNVWLDDVFGVGLTLNGVVVSPNTGATVTANLNHSGTVINGFSVSIASLAPGERRAIDIAALPLSDNQLTHALSASFGCNGADCLTPVTAAATAVLPKPKVSTELTVISPVAMGGSTEVNLVLTNPSAATAYNIALTAALPWGTSFTSGSTRWRVNGGVWNGPSVVYNPNPMASPLRWSPTEISGFSSLDAGGSIEMLFLLDTSCAFTGGNVTATTRYESPSGTALTDSSAVAEAALDPPALEIAISRINRPLNCGETITWDIAVKNVSGYTLPIVWIEDTLDAAYTFVSSTGDMSYCGDNGTNSGQMVTWELVNLPHNATASLTLSAVTDSSPCSPNLTNTVRAYAGLGVPDGSSATKPGVDAPDNGLCLAATPSAATRTETRKPAVGNFAMAASPAMIDACNDATTLTVEMTNTGLTDAYCLDLVAVLPSGLTYVSGSSELYVGTDNAGVASPIGDPTIASDTLIWMDYSNKSNNLCYELQADGGDDTLVLKFAVSSSSYATANLDFTAYFYDCCGDTQHTYTATPSLTALYPNLSVTQTPLTSQVDCAAQQTWTITVTNNGTGNAQVVRVETTPGAWLTVNQGASTAVLTDMGGGVWGWEFNYLASGNSMTFTLAAAFNSAGNDCSSALRQLNSRAIWGCGTSGEAVDNNPTTQSYDSTYSTWSNAAAATLTIPDLAITAITPQINATADGVFSRAIAVALKNQGSGAILSDFVVSVTDGKGWTGTGTHSGALSAGASADVAIDTSSWTAACHSCGSTYYSFNATVDSGGAVCECDESNNTYGPVTYGVSLPDLAVGSVTASVGLNGLSVPEVTVPVEVSNSGCAGATGVVVRLSNSCTAAVPEQTVSLTAGETKSLTFTVTPPSCATCSCSYTATIDPDGLINECDGANNAKTSSPVSFAPEMSVEGNGLEIANGAATPASENHTDFGRTGIATGSVVRTFTILNTGSGALNLTGDPLVAIGGANGSDFTVNTAPDASVDAWDGTTAFQITFNPSASGTRNATVSIANNDGDETPYTFAIRGAGNVIPSITGQGTLTTPEETELTLTLSDFTVSDSDDSYPTGFTLTVADGTNYTHTGNAITPSENFTGTLTVPVSVHDGMDTSASFNASVTVTNINDAPVITGQNAVSTPEETAREIVLGDLLVTDPDNAYPTGFTLTVSDGANYSRVGNTITPAAEFNGVLTVPVKVNDGTADSNTYDLNVAVTAVNDAPVITGQNAVSTPEETAREIVLGDLLVTDPDNVYPTGFTLTVSEGANYSRVGNTITPAADFNGALTIPVKVNDGAADSNTYDLSVTVTAINDAPVITGQNAVSTPEETAREIVLGDLLVTDPDNAYPTGFTLTVSDGANYSRVGNTITPAVDFNGALTVPVKVNDGVADSNTYDLSVIVTAVNDAPVLAPIGNQFVREGEILSLTLSATDTESDGLTYSATNLPAGASLDPDTGAFSWTPGSGTAGIYDTITFVVTDDGTPALSDSETITITVHCMTLALTSPNGGESWILGNTYITSWNGACVASPIKLKLWRNGSFTGYYLTGIEANDGEFAWKIPRNLPEGSGYKVEVYTSNYSQSDTSDGTFTLAPRPVITLTSPNGGETWLKGGLKTVTWTDTGVGALVKLKLWKGGVFTGIYLTGQIDNDGGFDWKIPAALTPGNDYTLQIYTPDYAYSDFSDAAFIIAERMQLTSPNGGESWRQGGTYDITWTAEGAGPLVKLRLFKGGAFTGLFLTGTIDNDGGYAWTVPTNLAPGGDYSIQVYTPDYAYTDKSDAPFTVNAGLTSPNGGETWTRGDLRTVTWDAPEMGASVKLKLFRDKAFTGYFLTEIIDNDGAFEWRIPTSLEAGTGYKLMLYTPEYSWLDYSDLPFTLE